MVPLMAWCRQAMSHYLSQCWPRSMSQYGVSGPQWVNEITKLSVKKMYLKMEAKCVEKFMGLLACLWVPLFDSLCIIYIYIKAWFSLSTTAISNSLWSSDAIRGNKTKSVLVQVMAWHQPGHRYLYHCWFLSVGATRYIFKNVVCKVAAISFKPQSVKARGAPPYMIFVFWWYVNHLWCNLNTLGPLTKIWIFLPFRPVRLPWQPGLCAEKLVLGHFWGAKSEKLKKVLENLFLIIKQKMNIKLFTEGFLEILKKKFFFNFHWLCCRGRAKSAIFGQ